MTEKEKLQTHPVTSEFIIKVVCEDLFKNGQIAQALRSLLHSESLPVSKLDDRVGHTGQ